MVAAGAANWFGKNILLFASRSMKDTNGFAQGAMLKCGMELRHPVQICK
jgi:hypothetical protein